VIRSVHTIKMRFLVLCIVGFLGLLSSSQRVPLSTAFSFGSVWRWI